jgi:hypothetical protein
LAEDKRIRDLKAANAIKSKADREKERQEEFTRLNEIQQRIEKDRQLMEDAIATTNAAISRQGEFSIEQLEFYQNQLEEINDEEAWLLEERRIRTERANRAETDAADKANKDRLDKEKGFAKPYLTSLLIPRLALLAHLKNLIVFMTEDSKEASEKAFNRSKALNIAESIISTISSAQKHINLSSPPP